MYPQSELTLKLLELVGCPAQLAERMVDNLESHRLLQLEERFFRAWDVRPAGRDPR